jgi:hypothetical protein
MAKNSYGPADDDDATNYPCTHLTALWSVSSCMVPIIQSAFQ